MEAGPLRSQACATLALLDSTGPAGYGSAPQADAAIAAVLIGIGLAPDEALSLLLHSCAGKMRWSAKARGMA